MLKSKADKDEEKLFSFKPPLFKQRDDFVYNLLKTENTISVLDLGCAECRLLRRFRHLSTIENIVGVEIQPHLINDIAYFLKPLSVHYLEKRKRPLVISLYCGDFTQFDERLTNFDSAILIEVVEHLNADVLARLPENLFGRLQPKTVVMSTPNSEFNVCFGGEKKFRHWDHKFEWSRKEFQHWCALICNNYAYTVAFDGVGDPPAQHSTVGPCTQIAIFKRSTLTNNIPLESDINKHSLELVNEIKYPWVGDIDD